MASITPHKKGQSKEKSVRTEQHQLHEGVVIYRTPHSGTVWQFQQWDFTNKKYIRKSTRTKKLDVAKQVAEDFRTGKFITPKPPKELHNKSRVRTDKHLLFDGDAALYRAPVSGNVWQFQMWITGQKKHYRKSTRTRNLDEAIRVGKDTYLDIHSKLRTKEPVFPKTMREVVDEFLEQKKKDIGIARTYGRWVAIRSQTKHLLAFVGEETKITDISKHKWLNYYSYRRSIHPSVVETTLTNEKNTICSVFRYAANRNYISTTYLPEFPTLKKVAPRRREAFSLEDWEIIYYFFRTNQWKKNKNPKVEMQRRFITDFAMVLINTGIRFGEARRLLWKNMKFDKGTGRKKSVKISLSAEQTKTGVARKCIGRRGDVFDRIKSYSNFTSPNDYVFVNNETGAQISRAVYYKNWNYLVRETGLDNHRTDTTFYCFRHTYASWRVMAGVDVFLLSKMMGCSVKYIEQHYGQPELDKMTEQLTRDAKLEEMSRFV